MSTKLTRCFIAIELSMEVKNKISEYLVKLKQVAPSVRWVNPGGIHITLKFLGEIENELLEKVKKTCTNVQPAFNPFKISIGSFVIFPNKHICFQGSHDFPLEVQCLLSLRLFLLPF